MSSQNFNNTACQDSDYRSSCPRGSLCTFIHFDDRDMERYVVPENNDHVIPFSGGIPVHAPNASRSPSYPIEDYRLYHTVSQSAMQNIPQYNTEGFHHPNYGMYLPPPMLQRHDVPGRVNYEPNGDPYFNSQLIQNRSDMGGNLGATAFTPYAAPDPNQALSHLSLYAHNSTTWAGPYGPGVMNPDNSNMMMPVPDRQYYGNYPEPQRVVPNESPNNFYPSQEAINYPQYQTPPGPMIPKPVFISIPQDSPYGFDPNSYPEIYPAMPPPNYMGPRPDFHVDSNYAYYNYNLPTEIRNPPGFQPLPREPQTDPYWLRSSPFEFEELREALSFRTPSSNVLNKPDLNNINVGNTSRAIGNSHLLGQTPMQPNVESTAESDEHTLEEGMMALERHIDTEYKIS